MTATSDCPAFDAEKLRSIEELDKRDAAFHEAGHAIVAIALKSRWVRAWIWKNDTENPLEENTWRGKCTSHNEDPESKAIIGIAGAVAEAIVKGEWDDCWVFDFCEWDLSASDAEMIEGWDVEHIAEKAHHILMEKWHQVECIASELIKEDSLTDGMILDLIEAADAREEQ